MKDKERAIVKLMYKIPPEAIASLNRPMGKITRKKTRNNDVK